jgi:hypothetical protein
MIKRDREQLLPENTKHWLNAVASLCYIFFETGGLQHPFKKKYLPTNEPRPSFFKKLNPFSPCGRN